MYQASLFLGFPLTPDFEERLSKVRPQLLKLRMSGKEGLQEIEYKGTRYLGKNVRDLIEAETLKLLEMNVYSLLQQLVPGYSLEPDALVLLPLIIDEKVPVHSYS